MRKVENLVLRVLCNFIPSLLEYVNIRQVIEIGRIESRQRARGHIRASVTVSQRGLVPNDTRSLNFVNECSID